MALVTKHHYYHYFLAGLAGATFCAVPALAQSQVQMYGSLDIGIKKRAGSPMQVGRGFNNWLGWRGSERLDGGLEATFVAEMRFNLDDGSQEQPNNLMQGETTLGLRSETLGSIRLGRAMTPLWWEIWKYDPWINSGENASMFAYQTGSYTSDGIRDLENGYANFSRFENAVFYTSPTVGGWHVHAAAEAERDPLDVRRPAGVSFNYAKGGVLGHLALERNANDDRIGVVSLSWETGKLRLMASTARHLPRIGAAEKVAMVAANYRDGSLTWRAGYGRNFLLGHDKLGVGAIHHLSPRTGMYADVYRERAVGDANGAAVGIMHTF